MIINLSNQSLKKSIPWSVYSIEDGDSGWNVDSDKLGKRDILNQHAHRDNNTVEEEGDEVCHYFPHEEETV